MGDEDDLRLVQSGAEVCARSMRLLWKKCHWKNWKRILGRRQRNQRSEDDEQEGPEEVSEDSG